MSGTRQLHLMERSTSDRIGLVARAWLTSIVADFEIVITNRQRT